MEDWNEARPRKHNKGMWILGTTTLTSIWTLWAFDNWKIDISLKHIELNNTSMTNFKRLRLLTVIRWRSPIEKDRGHFSTRYAWHSGGGLNLFDHLKVQLKKCLQNKTLLNWDAWLPTSINENDLTRYLSNWFEKHSIILSAEAFGVPHVTLLSSRDTYHQENESNATVTMDFNKLALPLPATGEGKWENSDGG